MQIQWHHSKKEIKAWRKESAKKARDKAIDFLFDLRFSIDWDANNGGKNPMTSNEKLLFDALKQHIFHANKCGITIDNSTRITKLSTNNRLGKEDFEVVVGFYNEDKYKHYDKAKARNIHITGVQAIQSALLQIINKEAMK